MSAVEKFSFQYAGESEVSLGSQHSSVRLSLDQGRGVVGFSGRPTNGALFRDVLMTTLNILNSDLRYKGRDRTAYLAYLMKQGKKANAAIWEAQKAFLDAQFADDTQKTGVLDPVLTVDPDEISLEVFSRDESAYARLSMKNAMFEGRKVAHGTSCVDLPTSLVDRLDRLPGYLPLDLEVGQPLDRKPAAPAAREVSVPHSWLRGFLQVQSAAALPSTTCELAPIDIYNLLFALRTRKAKNPPRGLRFELIPGAPARLILEPWELVLESHGAPYQGKTPRVVRTFGRQRLLSLARALPYLQSARVQMLGPGLPVFWVFDFGLATLSVALTGWTDSSWASAASFDRLMPAAERGSGLADKLLASLHERGPQGLDALQAVASAPREEVRAALQRECLRGRVLFDVAGGVYRPRALLATPVADEAIRYGSPRESKAHRLIEGNAVEITKLHEVHGEGIEVHGEVNDKESHREFLPRFSMDIESRVTEAWCNCSTYQRSGLREGPCEHMIALRLLHARKVAEAEALRLTPEGRRAIRAETRTFTRRDPSGREVVYRVSLDDKVVQLQWGPRTAAPRHQRLWYDTDAQAREAYFARLESLSAEGYVDADAAGLTADSRERAP